MKSYLLSPGIEPTISISRDSHIYHSSTLAQVIVGISSMYVWTTTTALKDWLYFPTIKVRPVVHEKQLSGSQIRISIRITPNFELGLPLIITSLLTKFHQNPTSSLWEILLTNKHTKVIAISRFSWDNNRLIIEMIWMWTAFVTEIFLKEKKFPKHFDRMKCKGRLFDPQWFLKSYDAIFKHQFW